MVPSVDNAQSRMIAVHETIKGRSGQQRRLRLIALLGLKRPTKKDEARKDYDRAFNELRDAIGALSEMTARQAAVLCNVSDSTWRHTAARQPIAPIRGKKVVQPLGLGSRIATPLYRRKDIESVWKKYWRKGDVKLPKGTKPAALSFIPTFATSADLERMSFYAMVDPNGAIAGHAVINGSSVAELLAMFRGGAQIVRTSLTRALMRPWVSGDERQSWAQLWNDAVHRTRAEIEMVALTVSLSETPKPRRSGPRL